MTTNKPADDPTITLRSGDHEVTLTREPTATGERLHLKSTDGSIRLDSLALESLTWQEDAFFTDLVGNKHEEGDNPVETGESLQIGNEYSVVQLSITDTDDGPQLNIDSPKIGYSCHLDVAELAAITRQEMNLFSDLLRTPLGPVDDHHDDPLFH